MPNYNVAKFKMDPNRMEPEQLNADLKEKIQNGNFNCITPVPTTKEDAISIARANGGIIIEYETVSSGRALITGFYDLQASQQLVKLNSPIEAKLDNNLIDSISIAREKKATPTRHSKLYASKTIGESPAETSTITQRFKNWIRREKSSASTNIDINDPDKDPDKDPHDNHDHSIHKP